MVMTIAFVLSAVLAGCGAKTVSKGDAPDWYLNPPQAKDKLYGTGASEQMASIEFAKKVADSKRSADARTDHFGECAEHAQNIPPAERHHGRHAVVAVRGSGEQAGGEHDAYRRGDQQARDKGGEVFLARGAFAEFHEERAFERGAR